MTVGRQVKQIAEGKIFLIADLNNKTFLRHLVNEYTYLINSSKADKDSKTNIKKCINLCNEYIDRGIIEY